MRLRKKLGDWEVRFEHAVDGKDVLLGFLGSRYIKDKNEEYIVSARLYLE